MLSYEIYFDIDALVFIAFRRLMAELREVLVAKGQLEKRNEVFLEADEEDCTEISKTQSNSNDVITVSSASCHEDVENITIDSDKLMPEQVDQKQRVERRKSLFQDYINKYSKKL